MTTETKRSSTELDALADALELDDEIDPAVVRIDDTADLLAVAQAADAARADEVRLRSTVEIARAHGRSWARIGLALGVSRQAAFQRYGS